MLYEVTFKNEESKEVEAEDDIDLLKKLASKTHPFFPNIKAIRCIDGERTILPESIEWTKGLYDGLYSNAQYQVLTN